MRLLHPKTKCLALLRASATARASPSKGTYQDSAGWVNLLFIRVIFHPWWQQKRSADGHEQCFWKSQKPTPCQDQSVARHIGLLLSKILTPLAISETINNCSFGFLKQSVKIIIPVKCYCWLEQVSSMRSVILKVYDTWLSRTNHDLTSVMFLGVGNSKIALSYFWQGHTESPVIANHQIPLCIGQT